MLLLLLRARTTGQAPALPRIAEFVSYAGATAFLSYPSDTDFVSYVEPTTFVSEDTE